MAESVYRARVRPRHCDAQGMMHASRYYEYFEDAFLGWLDEHIGGYAALRAAGADLVVVASGCEHRRGAGLDDPLAIEVRPASVGRTSLSMSFTVRRETDVVAIGNTTYVAVSGGEPVPLPNPLRAVVSR
jgi:YbgC/YbaW family acyl-CoA thioester hydrolase